MLLWLTTLTTEIWTTPLTAACVPWPGGCECLRFAQPELSGSLFSQHEVSPADSRGRSIRRQLGGLVISPTVRDLTFPNFPLTRTKRSLVPLSLLPGSTSGWGRGWFSITVTSSAAARTQTHALFPLLQPAWGPECYFPATYASTPPVWTHSILPHACGEAGTCCCPFPDEAVSLRDSVPLPKVTQLRGHADLELVGKLFKREETAGVGKEHLLLCSLLSTSRLGCSHEGYRLGSYPVTLNLEVIQKRTAKQKNKSSLGHWRLLPTTGQIWKAHRWLCFFLSVHLRYYTSVSCVQ